MRAVSYFLVAAVMAAAVFAVAPHRLAAGSAASASPLATLAPVEAVAVEPVPSAPVATPSPVASAASPAAIVDTKDYAYAPDPVTVKAGDTILFKNSDSVAHTIAADDGSFDSGNMAAGATWSHTFTKPGTYAYFCAYHRYMKAKIVVK